MLICNFQFNAITFIQADTEKGPFRSNCSFSVSAHMYVMIQNGKLHTSKHQKQVSYRIFQKVERERSYICMGFMFKCEGCIFLCISTPLAKDYDVILPIFSKISPHRHHVLCKHFIRCGERLWDKKWTAEHPLQNTKNLGTCLILAINCFWKKIQWD